MNHRNFTLWDRVSVALWTASAALTAALYARLPAQIPVHFDLYGNSNGWVSKAVGAPLLLVFAAVTWALVRFGAQLLPLAQRDRYVRSPMELAALLTGGFLLGAHWCVMAAAMGTGTIGSAFGLLLGLFWMLLGLLMPRLRRNPFVGIRVRWTLSSDENWARTHRLAGQLAFVAGMVAVGAAALGSMAVAIVAVVSSALIPVAYSWWLAR